MKEKINIALCEYDIVWEKPEANYEQIQKIIQGIKADIFLLPEMFATGFSMNVKEIGEEVYGKSFRFLQQMAKEKNAVFCGTISTKDKSGFYNRLYWVEPNENFYTYDKRHLFSYGKEKEFYKAGEKRQIIEYKGWRFCPLVCFDLRFPVWSRNNVNYDVLFYLANWPKARVNAWDALLNARAMENMAYVAGVNRTGEDGYGLEYNGHSNLYDVLGDSMENQSDNIKVKLYTLTKEKLNSSREKFKFLNDRDEFKII